MAEARAFPAAQPVAVIGLACRFPDADDAPALLDTVLTGRRAFRRLPPSRLDLADYYQPDPAVTDATYSARAGVLEGWHFDLSAFGVSRAAFAAADRAHWLALETAARALAAAGLPAGHGLDRDRIGVIVGNSLAGDTSRANALRVRWPYVRRTINAALADADLPAELTGRVLGHAAGHYLAPFPPIGPDSLAGAMPAGIAAGISGYFGFRGGSYTVDSGGASSLQAVASACGALGAGDIDLAIAGGVDIGLDPLELIGMARTGALAVGNVRIYDQRPTGYLPAEGCGFVVLMRSAQARASGLPVYAELVGWGASADGGDSQAGGGLLAMKRAYERAGVDPAQVQLVEGNGTGTRDDDDAELAAWCRLRAGAGSAAALGSVKANIGHAKAAAGAAGLIKTVLAVSAGVLPPATGSDQPHPLLRSGDARLRLPEAAADWPSGVRLAGVSAGALGGSHAHLVLRHEPDRPRQDWAARGLRRQRAADRPADQTSGLADRPAGRQPRIAAFLLHADDQPALASELTRLAKVAAWLSDAEMADLACQLARRARSQGAVRVALVARHQEQLALLARQAAGMVPELSERLSVAPAGIYAADDAAAAVTLLLPDGHAWTAPQPAPADEQPATGTSKPGGGSRWRIGRSEAAADGAAVMAVAEAGEDLAADDEVNVRIIPKAAPSAADAEQEEPAEQHDSVEPGALADQDEPAASEPAADQPAAAPGLAGEMLGAAFVSSEIDRPEQDAATAIRALLGTLHWLDALGVAPAAAVGQGIPVLAWLVWADLLSHAVALEVAAALAGPAGDEAGAAAAAERLTAALDQAAPGQAGCRLVSAVTGQQVTDAAGLVELICAASKTEVSLAAALRADALAATVLVDCGTGALAESAGLLGCQTPACSVGAGETDEAATARAAAALFAAGALTEPPPLFAGRPFRHVDIWRDRTFITNPCQVMPGADAVVAPAAEDRPAADDRTAADGQPPGAEPDRAAGEPAGSSGVAPPGQHGQPASTAPGLAELRNRFERHRPLQAKLVVAGEQASVPAQRSDHTADAQAAEDHAAKTAAAGDGAVSNGAADIAAASAVACAIPAPAGLGGPKGEAAPPGVAAWVRCFTEELRQVGPASQPAQDGAWRVLAPPQGPFGADVSAAFTDSPSADRTLAVLGDPADPQTIETALTAAHDAARTGRLVVITTGSGLTGFFATLHAEQPDIGITVLRAPGTPDGLRAARTHASAGPGEFRELSVTAAGTASEVGMAARQLTGGADFPLGPQDVMLISRASRGTALALAQVVACCGAAIAVVGRPCADDDSQLVAGLEQLRSAGARLAYEVVDESNQVDMAAALVRIERRLGPVTAIGHAAAAAPADRLTELTAAEVSEHIASQHAVLGLLARAAPAGRLRLIVTFGSVAEAYGLPGAGALALASAALASQARQLAAGQPGCSTLHVDLPGWAAPGLGEQPSLTSALRGAGVAAIDLGAASRILLKALTTPDLPAAVAVHGRVAHAAKRLAAAAAQPLDSAAAGRPDSPADALRFVSDLLVHYPGIELISQPTLSLASDPYLADYRVDELPMLPPVVALEALAEAASVLAGRPLRTAVKVAFNSPVVLPAGDTATVRVCALREGDTIVAVLRCADTGYQVDHVRAEFSCAAQPAGRAAVPAQREGADGSGAGDAAISLTDLPARAGIVDGAEMYGPICFQSGRFRRIAILPEVTARSCRALARGADQQPWFAGPRQDSALVLGSPGLNDSALQALQACVPHRQLRPAGCESVEFSGRQATGVAQIRAVAAGPAAPAVPVPAQAVPAQAGSAEDGPAHPPTAGRAAKPGRAAKRAAGRKKTQQPATQAEPDRAASVAAGASRQTALTRPGDQLWDIEVTDAAGQPVVTWRGVMMHDAGPLPRNAAWPPALLSVFLERGATDLGLDGSLQVTVECGQPDLDGEFRYQAAAPDRRDPGSSLQGSAAARRPNTSQPKTAGAKAQTPAAQPVAGAARPDAADLVPAQAGPAEDKPAWPARAAAVGMGLLAGFTLAARASAEVACGWQPVQHAPRADQHTLPGHAAAYAQLRDATGEPADVVAARLAAVSQCLNGGAAPAVVRSTSDGWVLLSAGQAAIASTVVEMSGLSCPVAIAILTGQPAESRPAAAGRAAAQPARTGGERSAPARDTAMATT